MFHPRPVRVLRCSALFLILATPALGQTIAVSGNERIIAAGDTTPSTLDHTNFGAAKVNEEVIDRTFTIENVGGGTLRILGIQRVGGAAGNFTIPIPPSRVLLPSGASTSFTVRFIPGLVGGVRRTTLVITTNDVATQLFDFAIEATSVVPEPEINIKGNGVNITDGDPLPSLSDHTDFGSIDINAGAITRTFTLQNIGAAPLDITKFEFTGGNSSAFVFTSFPATRVPQGFQIEFQISFDPSTTGLHNVNVRIHNTDADESIFDFVIQGRGTTLAGEVSLFGNGVLIAAGDISPSFADHTKFESTKPGTSTRRTFTIKNTGTANLNIASIATIGAQAARFSVAGVPTAPLAPNTLATFDVIFRPTTMGVRSTTLRIQSDDAAAPIYDVVLRGAGGKFELVSVKREGHDAIIVFNSNPDTDVSNYFYTIRYSDDLKNWTALTSIVNKGGTVERYRHAGGYLVKKRYWRVNEVTVP